MRKDHVFIEYHKIKKEYEEKGLQLPSSIQHEYETKMLIKEIIVMLNKFANGNAISKSGWVSIDRIIEKGIPNDISNELKIKFQKTICEIKKMKHDLLDNREIFMVNEYTVTREGRKRIRLAYFNITHTNNKLDNI